MSISSIYIKLIYQVNTFEHYTHLYGYRYTYINKYIKLIYQINKYLN